MLFFVASTHVLAGVYHILTQVPYLLNEDLGVMASDGNSRRLQGAIESGLQTTFARNLFRSQVNANLIIGVLLLCIGLSRRTSLAEDTRFKGSMSKYSSSSSIQKEGVDDMEDLQGTETSIFRSQTTNPQLVAAIAALAFWARGVPGVWQQHPILPEWDVYSLDNPVAWTCAVFSSLYTLAIAIDMYHYCRRYSL